MSRHNGWSRLAMGFAALFMFATCAEARESVVFFAAHPDDTEGFAATAFLLKEKYDVYVVDFTGGERGCGEVRYLNGRTKKTREAEERAALAMLGTEPLYVGEIDGEATATPRAISTMARLLTELKPKAVFTHWPVDRHADHRHCSIAAIQAAQGLAFTPEFYFFEVLLAQTKNWHPLYSVDVTKTMPRKLELLRKYVCQNEKDCLAALKTKQAELRGAERVPSVGCAETFTTFDGRRIAGGVLESLKETTVCRTASPAAIAMGGERDRWTSAPLGSLKIGGTIGERIALTVDGNLKKLDYDKVFVDQFRSKNGKKTFIGTGNVMEGLVLLAKQTGDKELLAIKDRLVADIIAAQEPGGYIGCVRPDQRIFMSWDCEEVGFILDALVLDYRHYGHRKSLDAAVRAVDWMVANWKNPAKDWDKFIYDKEKLMGIAHGIWSVYEATRKADYLAFLTETFDQLNWDMPVVLERDIGLKGHACGYLDTCYAQLAMYGTLGDRRLLRQTARFLEHYLHGDGGLVTGLEGICECFNDSQEGSGCIGETCMSSYLLYTLDLAIRTGAVDPALAGDIVERTLYNGFFAAQDRDGRRLRYYTPLEGTRFWWPTDDYCCPVNYRRAMGHVPEMLLYANDRALLANVYSPLEGTVRVKGVDVKVMEETDYPTSGRIRFTLAPAKSAEFAFALRIPVWCDAATVAVNGRAQEDARTPGRLFTITRMWNAGDTVEVDFPMELRLVRGRKRQSGRCAFMRGPLVYAIDLKPYSPENLHPEERANSLGVKNEDVFLVWPETAKVVADDRARTGGTAIKVKGTLVSCQLGPECGWCYPREFTFTEFPDPEDTLTYFRIPNKTIRTVDDPLFTP